MPKVKSEVGAAAPAIKPPAVKKSPAKKVSATKAAAKVATKAKPPAAAPAAPPAAPVAEVAKVKQKLVRDSFTMPNADFDLIQVLKDRALNFKRPAKKSELLRAGLQVLSALTDAKLKSALDSLAPLKAGRPKKGD
jgi:hypothetical protein